MVSLLNNFIKSYFCDKNLLLFSGNDNNICDNNYFCVNNNFYYLTGYDISNLTLLYIKSRMYIFYKFQDGIWHDNKSKLKKINKKIIDIKEINKYTKNIKEIFTLDNIIGSKISIDKNIKINNYLIDKLCNKNRIIKKNLELKYIEKSCNLMSNVFNRVLLELKNPNTKNESHIINICKLELLKNNISKLAYIPICSNGINNSIIHYTYNNNKLKDGNILLLDIGCKYNGYCSDITRSLPINGKFTKIQKNIYNIVLKCQKMAISHLKEGINFSELEKELRILMYNELMKLNLVLYTKSIYKKIKISELFMPHSLGHSIGLEVHDPVIIKPLILKKNMVITIEPGIYFNKLLLNNKNANIKN